MRWSASRGQSKLRTPIGQWALVLGLQVLLAPGSAWADRDHDDRDRDRDDDDDRHHGISGWLWPHEPTESIVIETRTSKSTYDPGERATLTVEIKRRKSSGQVVSLPCSWKQRLDRTYYWPDLAHEVTVQESGCLRATFTTDPLTVDLPSTFTTLIGSMTPGRKSVAHTLGVIDASVLKLTRHIAWMQSRGIRPEIIARVALKRDALATVAERIRGHLIGNGLLFVAQTDVPIPVDNRISSRSLVAEVQGGFLNRLSCDPGAAIQGQKITCTASVENLRSLFPPNLKAILDDDPQDRWLVRLKWLGSLIHSVGPNAFSQNEKITHTFTSERLPAGVHELEVTVHKDRRHSSHDKLYSMTELTVPVEPDLAQPTWLAGYTPNASHRYVRELPSVSATATDQYGLMDPVLALCSLSGSLKDGSPYTLDVCSRLTATTNDQGQSLTVSGNLMNPQPEGTFDLELQARDLAQNLTPVLKTTITVDRSSPEIAVNIPDGLITRDEFIQMTVTISDASPFTARILQNGEDYATWSDPVKDLEISLVENEINLFEIIAQDILGNLETRKTFMVVSDTAPPVLSGIVPADGSTIPSLTFQVSGAASERMSRAVLVGTGDLVLSADGMRFSGSHTASAEGPLSLSIEAFDPIGNSARVDLSLAIVLKLLRGELVSVFPNDDSTKAVIRGAAGAAKPGVEIEATAGIFNSASTTANNDGSFQLELNPFTRATVTATDTTLNRSESITVTPQVQTRLTGIVRDTGNRPLPGARVVILGTDIPPVSTDAGGVFTIESSVTGDQTIHVTGDEVTDPCSDCPPRTFTSATINVRISLDRVSALENPIRLAPYYQDHTAQPIIEDQETVLTSPRAPGVTITIPAGALETQESPPGDPGDPTPVKVSMEMIPAEVATIPPPDFAQPDEVLSIEPGLSFTEPVEIRLPNTNGYAPGSDVVLHSMNSATGLWEPGGIATVSEDGTEIISKEGGGLMHFSQVFAAPIMPGIKKWGAQDRPGANTFDGAVATQIKLPAYRSMNQDVAPGLIYRSSWAQPNAWISNVITFQSRTLFNRVHDAPSAGDQREFAIFGDPLYTTVATQFTEPGELRAQFRTANIVSGTVRIAKVEPVSTMSFGMDLSSLTTGLYPYFAHYEMDVNRVTVKTVLETSKKFGIVGPPVTRIVSQKRVHRQFYETAYPPDIGGALFVQNRTQSEAGRGWRISGPERIYNLGEPRVFLEGGDGSVASYALGRTIETLGTIPKADSIGWNVDKASVRLDLAVDLATWPNVFVTETSTATTNVAVKEVTFDGTAFSAGENVATLSPLNGVLRPDYQFEHWHGTLGGWHTHKNHRRHPYSMPSQTHDVLRLPDGRVLWLSESQSAIYVQEDGSVSRFAGMTVRPPNFSLSSGINSSIKASNKAIAYCNEIMGIDCGDSSAESGFSSSSGLAPAHGFADGPRTSAQFNRPKAMAYHSVRGTVLIADTGNNLIRELDLNSGDVATFAGNQIAMDSGDGGSAFSASLFAPRAITVDPIGNVYVATSSGRIRLIDPTGRISTFAGGALQTLALDRTTRSEAAFMDVSGLAYLETEDERFLFISDSGHHRVVRASLDDDEVLLIAGNGNPGSDSGIGGAVNAQLNFPTKLGFDEDRNLLIVDSRNNSIRRVILDSAPNNGTLVYTPATMDHSSLRRNSDGTWTRSFRNGSTLSYDSEGRQTIARDRVGNEVSFRYDDGGRLEFFTDAAGLETQYHYGMDGVLTAVEDPAGRMTTFEVVDGLLEAVHFPDSAKRKFSYNGDGLLDGETNERGFTTSYTYNPLKRIEKVIFPDGSEAVVNDAVSLSAVNNYTGQTAGELKSLDKDDASSNILTNAKKAKTYIRQDDQGYVTEIKTQNNQKVTFVRDLEGRPIEIQRKSRSGTVLQHVKTTFNRCGDRIHTHDLVTGVQSSIVHDADLNPQGDCSFGLVLEQTDARGKTKKREYFSDTGLLKKETDALNRSTVYTYTDGSTGEPKGLMRSITDLSINRTTENFYDPTSGNLIRTKDPAGQETHFELYPGTGAVRRVINAKGQVTFYDRDTMGRLIGVTEAEGTPEATATIYEYHNGGLLKAWVDALGNRMTYEYTPEGRVASSTDPLGATTTLTYDESGNVTEKIDPNGNRTEKEYNHENQLEETRFYRKTDSGLEIEDTISFSYTQEGDLRLARDGDSEISFGYDRLQRLTIARSYGIGTLESLPDITLEFGYDLAGNRTSMTDPTGESSYTYSDTGELEEIVNPMGHVFTFTNDLGRRERKIGRTIGVTSIDTVISTDAMGFITRVLHEARGDEIAKFDYMRDPLGNRTSVRGPAGNRRYRYDRKNQLQEVAEDKEPEENPVSFETYGYDPIGNRIQDHGGSFGYVKNASDRNTDRIAEDYRYTYLFDANGNLVTRTSKSAVLDGVSGLSVWETTNFHYSVANQLKRIEWWRGTTLIKEAHYRYDALGRRIEKRIVDHEAPADPLRSYTRRLVYDGEDLLLEYDLNGKLLARYTHSTLGLDDVLSVDVTDDGVSAKFARSEEEGGSGAGTYIFLKDSLGSIVRVLNENAEVVQDYTYSAYGHLLAIRGATGQELSANPALNTSYAFAGRELDRESGLYYFRARYYDPNNGRFLQTDPHPGKLDLPITLVNRHAYAGNNPLNFTDPSGQSFWTDIRDFFVDVLFAVGAIAAIVLSGGTLAGAALAVGATAVGSLAIAGIQTLVGGGNFWDNFHNIFRWSAGFLTAGAIGAGVFGGGVKSAGANTVLQGYVQSNRELVLPIIGELGGGLTYGSSSVLSGVGLSDATSWGIPFAVHELGHTVQFGLLSSLGGTAGPLTYLGLGALGRFTPYGAWWERSANFLGGLIK